MFALLLVLLSTAIIHQNEPEANSIAFHIIDQEERNQLVGATVFISELNRGNSADDEGIASIGDLPSGTYAFEFRFVGFETLITEFEIPYTGKQPVKIEMHHEESHMEEITVSSARTTRVIDDSPVRVEAITLEEIAEKGNMRPGDIRMLLSESTGIQVQQTSPVSGSSNFRIQGLDGRYTQLLKDGFPLYSGFSGGLSIMQIPPLDLYQVEVIKGANSTLYGGGAIAGLINLITKQPAEERELSFLANRSTSNNTDLSGFYSEHFGTLGITMFSAYNRNTGYDPSGQGFSAIPEYDRFSLNPRVIWYANEDSRFMAAAQITVEDRLGGDMLYINGEDPDDRYFEQHDTRRITTQLSYDHDFSGNTSLSVKNSFNFLNRSISIPDFMFDGNQTASFSEAAIHHDSPIGAWAGGLNFWTDRFDEQGGNSAISQEFSSNIYGAFIQNTSELTDRLSVQTGFRADLVRPEPDHDLKGLFLLPAISALYKLNNAWSMRLGGGMGYKLPEMFTDDAENRAFRNVAPPDYSNTKAEQSYGMNYDVNFRTVLANEVVFRFNQLFYITHLDNPLILELEEDNLYRFNNLDGNVLSKGSETNVAFIYDPVKLFLGYTFIDANLSEDQTATQVPLNSPHQINAILMLEEHGSYRLGFEGYYYSRQQLTDGTTGRGYTIFGIMGEKTWGPITVFANLENIFDTRQTRFGPIYSGSREQPDFYDIYAPLEGRYVNTGIKIKL